MKFKLFKPLFLFALSLMMLTSCSIEKRQHLKGYHIDFKKRSKSDEAVAQKEKTERDQEVARIPSVQPNKTFIASASDHAALFAEQSTWAQRIAERIPAKDDSIKCDRITLINGDEIPAKVVEVGSSEVKYKKCTNPDGPSYTIRKSEVFMIVYANGDKDVFNAQPTQTINSTPNERSASDDSFDSQLYGLSSLVAGISSMLLFWIWAPIFGLLVGGFAIIAGAIVIAKTSKDKSLEGGGMAVAGIVTGALGMIITILFTIFLLSLIL